MDRLNYAMHRADVLNALAGADGAQANRSEYGIQRWGCILVVAQTARNMFHIGVEIALLGALRRGRLAPRARHQCCKMANGDALFELIQPTLRANRVYDAAPPAV